MEEANASGVKQGQQEWADTIKPLAVAAGFPGDKLYPESRDITGFFDKDGALVLIDHPGGLLMRMPNDKILPWGGTPE